jgi:uncharacterized protein (DUF983 family)
MNEKDERCPGCGVGQWSINKVDGVRVCFQCGGDYERWGGL